MKIHFLTPLSMLDIFSHMCLLIEYPLRGILLLLLSLATRKSNTYLKNNFIGQMCFFSALFVHVFAFFFLIGGVCLSLNNL